MRLRSLRLLLLGDVEGHSSSLDLAIVVDLEKEEVAGGMVFVDGV